MQHRRVKPWRGTAYVHLLRNRSFVALWLGQTISFVGDYFYWLAIPIMVERLTGSALQVGLSVIASTLPFLLLGPVAGVFVDRWDRKRTMIISDLLRGLLVLASLLVQTSDQVWIYYTVAFLRAWGPLTPPRVSLGLWGPGTRVCRSPIKEERVGRLEYRRLRRDDRTCGPGTSLLAGESRARARWASPVG